MPLDKIITTVLTSTVFFHSTVPTSTYHTLAEFFGTNACMDEFKGRAKKMK